MSAPRFFPTLAAAMFLITACGTTVPFSTRSTAGSSLSLGATGTNQDGAPAVGGANGIATGQTNAGGNAAGPQSSATIASGNISQSPNRGGQASGGSAGGSIATRGSLTTGPLTIGMVYSNNGAANSALGLATSASAGPQNVMGALVAALNKQGGLAGRKLAVEYYPVDATSSDYSTEAQSACANFTQDHPVPVVLDFTFGTRYGMATCLARYGVADFGIGTSDTVSDNAAGLFASPDWMTSSRRYRAVITGLHTTGYLSPHNKIGVLLEDCGYLQRAYQQTVLPEISQLGLKLVDTETFACTAGFSSAGPDSATISSAILHLRTDGADRLLIVSDYEQVALLLLANQAESQGWRPGYMLSSAAETEVIRSDIPSVQWPQLHGIGWSPGLDIDDPNQPPSQVEQRCVNLIKDGGLAVSGWQNIFTANAVCTEIFFVGSALQHSSGDASGGALMTAIDSLGASFVAPGIVDGSTFFGPSRHDGPAAEAPFAYVGSCGCMKYTGPSFTVP